MNRRRFCFGAIALPTVLSASSLAAMDDPASQPSAAVWDSSGQIRFVLKDLLEHPFFWWPRTLLCYPIEFRQPVDLSGLGLKRRDTGEQIPIQFSEIMQDQSGLHRATLNFFSDLPSGGSREFVLTLLDRPSVAKPQVTETQEGNTIVLDAGVMRVRIPASQAVQGAAPGPVLQVSRGGKWIGSSEVRFNQSRITRITTRRVEQGPLFIAYEISYEAEDGSRYETRVQANGGVEFVRFQENMEAMHPGLHGEFTCDWTGFGVTHRQSPNHPYPVIPPLSSYNDYAWERVDAPFFYVLDTRVLPKGELPFKLGIYQTSTAFHSDTSANFWDERTGDALGVFIDRPEEWQDHEYANHTEAETLQVRYVYEDGKFSWKWPLARGSRSSCIAFYDHELDKQAMHDLDTAGEIAAKDGDTYKVVRAFTSHTMFLQNRHNTIDLNRVKDWVLEYPENSRQPPVIFSMGSAKDAADLERRVLTSPFVGCLAMLGTRENGGLGSSGIVNFSAVPCRQVQGWWVDGFNRLHATMTRRQRTRLTAMYLLVAYVTAGEDFMPLIPMLSGHPNFLADVKAVPAAMAFLFPEHPMAATWADLWEKSVELNTRYNTRPEVTTWDAAGGRWTENLGTYVWAFLRPSLRTEYLLRQYDGRERYLTPQLAEMAEWLVNSLSAPYNGESEAGYNGAAALDSGHAWGILAPGKGPRRVHPPQGAHAERRVPPRSLWYLGTCLQRYAPLAAEYAMWAARPTDQNFEQAVDRPDAWDVIFAGKADNRGTNPHLSSNKYTGYGLLLRSAVDTPDEVSVHLQQIDRGPNYRWGRSSEGGCGMIYYFAKGQAYSMNGAEDVGDRNDQDTDFCTNFGVYKNGSFHAIGMNVLSRPLYNLGTGQFAEIVPREGAESYSWPEYVSRSVLLAGHEYFVVHDHLLDPELVHRLSWFVRQGDELPTIKLVRGGNGDPRATQRTSIQTAATFGVYYDGVGDSMAVVSHHKEIGVTATPFGCRVHLAGIEDLIFRNPVAVHFAEGGNVFEGTTGFIRTGAGRMDFALFHGTKIGVGGLTISTSDTELGIGGYVVAGQPPCGEYHAPLPASITMTSAGLSGKTNLYVDGQLLPSRRDGGSLVVELAAGAHHWELTDGMPVPMAPRIVRTEDHAGGALVIVEPVASASQYRLELSKDDGASWTRMTESAVPQMDVKGLADGSKVHVRAIALNAAHESAPGHEYPVYVSNQAPPPPDAVRVHLAPGGATLYWGEVLGVSRYRVYSRLRGETEFRKVFEGMTREYVYRSGDVHANNAVPDGSASGSGEITEFCVTCVNANGESIHSQTADTDPSTWRNWDPKPGEPFRRVASYEPDTPPSASEWPRYYPA